MRIWDVAPKSCGKAFFRNEGQEFKEGCKEKENSSEWTLEKVREACEKVAREEVGRLGIVQEILTNSTDFLTRIIAPVDGIGGVTLSYVCPHCKLFPVEWYQRDTETATTDRRSSVAGGAQRAAANTIGRRRTGYWWHNLGSNANEAEVFRAHAAPQGLCVNLVNAAKVLANHRKDGDSKIPSIVTGMHEKSKRHHGWAKHQ